YLKKPEQIRPIIFKFASKVHSELLKTGKLDDNSRFFVGCPSGWKDADRERYKKIFLDAGFKNVDIISESRAAFMFVRESGELNIPDNALSKPTLIIDAGSSTTDFTFVKDLQTVELYDFGENYLGGGIIDKLLLLRNVHASPNREKLERIFRLCPQYEARCELEARKVKEMYFTSTVQTTTRDYAFDCESSVKIYYERPPVTCDIRCTKEDMKAILNKPVSALGNRSFLQAYRQSLLNVKRTLGNEKPAIILLTGGASRMGFIAAIAREVFADARIIAGAEPEFSISRGLCYALRIDGRTQRFMRRVKSLIDSTAVEDIVSGALPRLFALIAPVIAAELTGVIAPNCFDLWRSGQLKTLDDMNAEMRQRLSRSLMDGALKEALEPVTRDWLEIVRPRLEKLTDPICAECRLPFATLQLRLSAPVGAGQLRIDAEKMVNLDVMQTALDVVIASIVAALLGGGGVALLMAGPIGFIMSFVIGFIASRMGTTLAMKHIGKFNMPAFMRLAFTRSAFSRSLSSKEDRLKDEICAQLVDMSKGDDPQIEKMVADISAAIEAQLSAMAQKARMLIH
ncbi:MAG: hypothetical protein Q4D04_03010, partial [Clostridia bacterium]|nr:hypothetical protein [Clostridia bacterium]